MQGHEARRIVRNSARAYEQSLDPEQRKQLGQFFTGIPLGKLLAHLALLPDTRTVLDPMAGHGDLLDATNEAAAERRIPINRLDGIEIDSTTADRCRDRLAAFVRQNSVTKCLIIAGDAFDPGSIEDLPVLGYDLVITNPPYVRYQSRSHDDTAKDSVRTGLGQIVEKHQVQGDSEIWKVIAQNYSGLADLSVPSWILAGSLVRPGGRLALVVPATWRSRDYADVIRYLLLRCFMPEIIVADTPPGWFSDALVRTHLVIAKRLGAAEARKRLDDRNRWYKARWIHIAPDAANKRSLVGAAFKGKHPEADFAAWAHANFTDQVPDIQSSSFDLHHEWSILHSRIARRRWYPLLESDSQSSPLFSTHRKLAPSGLPAALTDMLPRTIDTSGLISLKDSGICIGQGLRTGCNGFFYVTSSGIVRDRGVQVTASPALGSTSFIVPSNALHPVIRRQAEMRILESGETLPGYVLDLRAWVLPEDYPIVESALTVYKANRVDPPHIMPAELATFVRHASKVTVGSTAGNKPIPTLSAVRTNVRKSDEKFVIPRFWYMLPDFTPRHLPAAFVARVNQGTPWIECNSDPPMLIDANFSTLWTLDEGWTRFGLKALLNSIWCRTFMEVIGTPLGGGALKLEAAHLRQILVPDFSAEERLALDNAGRKLTRDSDDVQADINRIVLRAIFTDKVSEATLLELARRFAIQTNDFCSARQGTTP